MYYRQHSWLLWYYYYCYRWRQVGSAYADVVMLMLMMFVVRMNEKCGGGCCWCCWMPRRLRGMSLLVTTTWCHRGQWWRDDFVAAWGRVTARGDIWRAHVCGLKCFAEFFERRKIHNGNKKFFPKKKNAGIEKRIEKKNRRSKTTSLGQFTLNSFRLDTFVRLKHCFSEPQKIYVSYYSKRELKMR